VSDAAEVGAAQEHIIWTGGGGVGAFHHFVDEGFLFGSEVGLGYRLEAVTTHDYWGWGLS
jgi:hypothetical protein